MNELQNFDFEGNEVRTIQRDSITWFAANDVAKNLGLSNTTVAVSRLDDDEVTKFNLGGLSGKTNFILSKVKLSNDLSRTIYTIINRNEQIA